MRKVELLAPARDLEAGLAAVECGADAVYVGGPGFGARQAAGNSVDDIAALVRRAHLFGVRVYATLNTLLMDDELAEAQAVAQSLLDVGVDALIVQDMAWLRMPLRQAQEPALVGELVEPRRPEFHASTQTAAMTPERVRFLAAAGFSRVVLERAMSLDEIRQVASALTAFPLPDKEGCPKGGVVELEAFIHGAICVGYSGQCYLSRAMTGGALRQAQDGARSGNRGTCSQPCRLAWDLVDDAGNVLARGKHLLSVRDLDLSARLGQLIDAGVTSLKIEGRLKDANYVRNVVSHYNRLLGELGVARTSAGRSTPDFVPNPTKSFTRGASEWFLDGAPRQARDGACGGVATFDSPKATGEYIGRVEKMACDRTGGWWVAVATRNRANAELAAGDGICFSGGGTNVNRMAGGRVYLNDHQGVTVGTDIYRNYDHAFNRALERSRTKRRIAVAASVSTSPGRVEVRFVDETGIAVTASREGDFAPARDPLQMTATMADELSKSGDTIFAVTMDSGGTATPSRANAALSPQETPQVDEEFPFIPVSVVAALRREGLEKLLAERQKSVPPRHQASENPDAKFPKTPINRYENITNRLAERFYRDHGADAGAVGELVEPQLELAADLTGAVVMRSRYCLRREMGLCSALRQARHGALRQAQHGALRQAQHGALFLVHGGHRFSVETDCAKCEMTLVKL